MIRIQNKRSKSHLPFFAKNICYLVFFTFLSVNCLGQEDASDLYWKAVTIANKHYDKAEYKAAAAAYENAFKFEKEQEYAEHRLFAAASNCMINNEIGVKDNLFALLPVSTKNDMKKVLVNYKIFDKL